jgi:O-antigen ligase
VDTAIALLVAAAVAGAAFGAEGGLQLGRATTVEICATLLGAGLSAAAIVVAPLRSRFWGGLTLAALVALTVWTAVSVTWSIEPSDSWIEANRTLSYLAVFAGGIALVRLAPTGWPALLAGVLLGSVVVCGYALLTKVFPGAFTPDEFYSRLREPFSYWNATGLAAALGVPPALWLGSRRWGHGAVNALAFPAIGLFLVTIMLSYSRGSLVALGIGLIVWFAIVPLRLRGFAVLAASAVPAALVTAWAFERKALVEDDVIVAQRADAGHELGVVLLLMIVLLLLVGVAFSFSTARRPLAGSRRRLAGICVAVVLALLVAAGVVAMALSSRGLGGTISHTWAQFTDPEASVPSNDPDRLTATGSVRARYWRDGLELWKQERWLGLGAGSYATGRFQVREDTAVVRHAHGYWNQTLADLGIVGLALSILAGVMWLGAAGRAVGLGVLPRQRRDRAPPDAPERIGLVTIAVVAIVFAFHNLVDWTWFVPGLAMLGLLCAGWVAGRGPAFQPVPEAPTDRARWLRIASAAGVVVAALVAAWTIWQPERSVAAGDKALSLIDNGRFSQARSEARHAHDVDPLAIEPLIDLAAAEEASGRPVRARVALVDAVELQPSNPAAWKALAAFELRTSHPQAALRAARAAVYLDPEGEQTRRLFLTAFRAAGPA